MDRIEELAAAFARFPGIGPRQGRRFVFHLLAAPSAERAELARLVEALSAEIAQCPECLRFHGEGVRLCRYCADSSRSDAELMIVEKDQDLVAVERMGSFRGRYFVLGGVLALSKKTVLREKELARLVERRAKNGLKEIVLALSATSEGEHTADYLRTLLKDYRDTVRISTLGRGLASGNELEYADAQTLREAFLNRSIRS